MNFRTGSDIPQQYRVAVHEKRRKSGRPVNDEQDQAFVKICALLQSNDEEQYTISKLVHEMDRHLMDTDSVPYGNQYMKSKLKEKYGDSIHISETGGFHGIVTMREKTDSIPRSYFQNANDGDQESQKMALIETAARLIKSDIKANVPPMRDVYPDASQLKLEPSLQFIPDSLTQMLNLLCVGNDTQRKVAAIGQCVFQAVRPRAVIAPLQIGLAAQVHHLHRSKFLVDSLSALGFCSSYSEVLRFEKNAACSNAPNVLGEAIDLLDVSMLFTGDNVDHNILTIDGKGTFHGMGIIAALTPRKQFDIVVPRKQVAELHVRTYLQVMTWMRYDEGMDATDWGWRFADTKNILLPVMTEQDPAPQNLLKIIHCQCTTACLTLRCSCNKYGLACSSACGSCQLSQCNNMHVYSMADDEDDSDAE